MILDYRSYSLITFSSFVLLVAFQNCSPKNESSLAESSVTLPLGPETPEEDVEPNGPLGTPTQNPENVPDGPVKPSQSDADIRAEFKRLFPASWLDMPQTQLGLDSFDAVPAKSLSYYLPTVPYSSRKPNVLSIGDSISLCYLPYLRQQLSDRYNYYRIPHNGASTENGLNWLDVYLEAGPFETVIVNWGLHDSSGFRRVSETQRYKHKTDLVTYRQRLIDMLTRIKATGARVVFILSTPTRDPVGAPVNGVEKGTWNEDVQARNSVAREVAALLRIELIDPVDRANHPEDLVFSSDRLHFEAETCRTLGGSIARALDRKQELPLERPFWKLTAWSECSGGRKVRAATCSRFDGSQRPASECSAANLAQPARVSSCQPEAYRWVARGWGACRNNSRSRIVRCINSRGTIKGDIKCQGQPKPATNEAC